MISRRFSVIAISITIASFLVAGCQPTAPVAGSSSAVVPASATKAPASESDHGHKPSAHGGTLVSIGKDNFHAEAVFEQGGKLRLYILGADESKVGEVETQTLAAFVKVGGMKDSIPFELKANSQPGDQNGKTSQFVGEIPAAAIGKLLIITIPSLRIGSDRYRIAFNSEPPHADASMPDKLGSDEERKLFLAAGGAYTEADIKANGSTIPSVKFKGIRAEHDDNPKAGEKICPISKTKANPKFTWVIGGKPYEFCCTPCIEEFVALAKEKPGEIKDSKEYVK